MVRNRLYEATLEGLLSGGIWITVKSAIALNKDFYDLGNDFILFLGCYFISLSSCNLYKYFNNTRDNQNEFRK